MATSIHPTGTSLQGEFRKMVREHGKAIPVDEFVNGGVLQANIYTSDSALLGRHIAAHAKEEAIKRCMYRVASECPKMCAKCGALEMVGSETVHSTSLESNIQVRARCTSAGYCPNVSRVKFDLEDFEREYMNTFTAATPAPAPKVTHASIPSALLAEQFQEVANKVLEEKRHLKPSSAPKTKAPLVW